MLEGYKVNVPNKGGRKNPQAQFIVVSIRHRLCGTLGSRAACLFAAIEHGILRSWSCHVATLRARLMCDTWPCLTGGHEGHSVHLRRRVH